MLYFIALQYLIQKSSISTALYFMSFILVFCPLSIESIITKPCSYNVILFRLYAVPFEHCHVLSVLCLYRHVCLRDSSPSSAAFFASSSVPFTNSFPAPVP